MTSTTCLDKRSKTHMDLFYSGVSHVQYTCHCMQGKASKGLLLADVWSFHDVQNTSNFLPFSGLLAVGVASREPYQCRIRFINEIMKYGSRDYRLTYHFNIRQVPRQQGDRITCQMTTTQSDISKRESLFFEITWSDTRNGPQALVTQDCFCKELLQILELTHLPLDKMVAISQTTVSDALLWMNSRVFWLKFHRNLFLLFQLTIAQHLFR